MRDLSNIEKLIPAHLERMSSEVDLGALSLVGIDRRVAERAHRKAVGRVIGSGVLAVALVITVGVTAVHIRRVDSTRLAAGNQTVATAPAVGAPSTGRTGLAATAPAPPIHQTIGQPVVLGAIRLTVFSVQDPLPPSPQVQPASGNRLVSITYEALNQDSTVAVISSLPDPVLRDSMGANYELKHGRSSIVGGSGSLELPPGKSMEHIAVFEIPRSTAPLQVVFRSPIGTVRHEVVVNLG